MLPDPLHPAVVHFPIVLALLLPIFCLGALWAIGRGAAPQHAWGVPAAGAAALALATWAAVETGETQEARVARVLAEGVLPRHEQAAEMLLVFAGVLLLLVLVGLGRGVVGSAARLVATAGALALLAAVVRVGATGGELVYRHGAASAYTDAARR